MSYLSLWGFFKYFKDRFAYLYVYTSSLTGNSYFSFYMDFEPISTFLYQHKFQTNDKYIHKSCWNNALIFVEKKKYFLWKYNSILDSTEYDNQFGKQ